MSEAILMKHVQMMASKLGLRLFRNNTGMGWAGKATKISKPMTISLQPGDVVIRKARPLRAGLCEGSSDLIGFKPTLITPQMVGQTIAVFTAIETKTTKGKATTLQQNFIQMVQNFGGIGFICRSVESFKERFECVNKLISKN